MKLFFDRSDSFYKIFKSIEKIPDGKSVNIEIHPQNQFFKNIRRGKQLIELLKEKKMHYTLVTDAEFVSSYFTELGEEVILNKDHKVKKLATLAYNFFFNIKSFHLQMINKKDYLSFVVLWLESLVVLVALYIFYVILVPTAAIHVKPSYNIEEVAYNFRYYPVETPLAGQDAKFISIPYYKSSIDHEMSFSTPLSELKYNIINAKWFAKLTNDLTTQITLKPNSKLITPEGILYKTLEWITIPGKWSVTVPVEALEKDDKEEIIWSRGNINAGTKLELKNLQGSIKDRITAQATVNFSGGKFFTEGIISQADLENFRTKAQEQLAKTKRETIMKQVKTENIKPLFFDDMIDAEIYDIKFNKEIGQTGNIVDGVVKVKLSYRYIYRDELMSAVYKYTTQRPNQSFALVEIDRNSAILYDRFLSSTGVYIIPTKVNTIRWYNFTTDVAGLRNQIKEKISWKEVAEAKKLLLTLPNIGAVDIKISPFWISKVPNVLSRIKIDVVK